MRTLPESGTRTPKVRWRGGCQNTPSPFPKQEWESRFGFALGGVMTSIVTARINFWEKIPEGHVVFNIDVSQRVSDHRSMVRVAQRCSSFECDRVETDQKSERTTAVHTPQRASDRGNKQRFPRLGRLVSGFFPTPPFRPTRLRKQCSSYWGNRQSFGRTPASASAILRLKF